MELPENTLREAFTASACLLIPLLGLLLVGLLVWKFTRSAVRSGVQQANARTPTAPQLAQPPAVMPSAPPPPPSDEHIRRIVREELQRLLAARAAAKAKPGSTG